MPTHIELDHPQTGDPLDPRSSALEKDYQRNLVERLS